MELSIHTTSGGLVEIRDFDEDSLLALIEELESDTSFLHFDLDDGKTHTYVNRAQITRIDVMTS